MKKLLSIILILLMCGCSNKDTFTYDESLGTSYKLEGNSVIVSVYLSDDNYYWDTSYEPDIEIMQNVNNYMKVATSYLSEEALKYNKTATFISDIYENSDLYYEATYSGDATADDAFNAENFMNSFINENIDVEAIRNKYKADNVIFFMIMNTDENSEAITCTRNYYEGMEYPYEIVFLFNMDYGVVNCPAVYAHEILHTFGVPDLYYEDADFNITSLFLDYVAEYTPNDIMYYCSDIDTNEYVYDRITNDLSELDAYYAGLTDKCEVCDTFNLKYSDFIGK